VRGNGTLSIFIELFKKFSWGKTPLFLGQVLKLFFKASKNAQNSTAS
jgi:hypothetical protein